VIEEALVQQGIETKSAIHRAAVIEMIMNVSIKMAMSTIHIKILRGVNTKIIQIH
jgi:hypothetical protein